MREHRPSNGDGGEGFVLEEEPILYRLLITGFRFARYSLGTRGIVGPPMRLECLLSDSAILHRARMWPNFS